MKLRHGMIGGVLVLAGCGLPPAVMIASYAVDGISYVATGKSVTDHALSAFAQQDCALHRFVTDNGNVCSQTLSDDTLLAAADEDPIRPADGEAPDPVLVATIGNTPDDDGLVPDDAIPDEVEAVVYGGVSKAPPQARYLVIGSFADPANAGRLVDGLATLSAAATTVDVDGRTMHRVVVPADMDTQVAAAGFADAWPIDLCAASLSAEPCAVDEAPVAYLAALPQ